MEELYNLYCNKIVSGTDETKMFSEFFTKDREKIQAWVDKHMEKLENKNNERADNLRRRGNQMYTKKSFKESVELYNKALCCAIPESENYSLILSNRSAVFYMMEDYENSLKDVQLCTESNCSENIRLKVLIRKIKCCAKLNLREQTNAAFKEALDLLINDDEDKRKEILSASQEKSKKSSLKRKLNVNLPELTGGLNKNFLYASSAIRLAHDETRGRHVIANQKLQPGDVLFVEKPFVFAPVFVNESMELSFNKCMNCLKTVYSCVACNYCIKVVFCDTNCREICWNEFHKWECLGMQADLWYHLGIAYPALRTLIRGINRSGLRSLSGDFKDDTRAYGNHEDNYGYFDKLLSNICKMTNVLPIIISTSVVVLYLEKVKFFEWLLNEESFSNKNSSELVELIGGRLVKHIAQLQCNASVICHKDGGDMPSEDNAVACAIYPSISMMNHSCQPNITIYYVRDMAIAEAAETIEANEEVFNCYGIDYRYADWESRQEHCRNLYYFNCQCRACRLEAVS